MAAEAGVAYGLVYHYFGSKEQLLDTIFRRTWTNMLEAVEEVERTDGTAREQIQAIAKIVLGAGELDPDLIRVLIREVARGPQLEQEIDAIARAFDALERVVARGQEKGELRTDVEPRLAASTSTERSRRSSRAGCSVRARHGRRRRAGRGLGRRRPLRGAGLAEDESRPRASRRRGGSRS